MPGQRASEPRSKGGLWRSGVLWGLSLAALLGGCSQGVAPGSLRAPLIVDEPRPSGAPSPAVWVYHPRQPAKLRAELELGPGARLYVGDLGERWLYRETDSAVQVASSLAGESLVSVSRTRAGGFSFLGEGGTHYAAEQALGAFVRVQQPPERFAQLSAYGSTSIGIGISGQLYSSQNAGAGWSKVGPSGATFQQVAAVTETLGVAMAVPEELWGSRDRGKSWSRLGVSHRGVTALSPISGELVAQSIAGPRLLRWEGEQASWQPPGQHSGATSPELPLTPAFAPDANAIADERAFIDGDRYFELEREGEHWTLHALSAFGTALSSGQARSWSPELPIECGRFKVAGHGAWFYFACALRDDLDQIAIWRSSDGGHAFIRDGAARGDIDALHLAVGAQGALLASGFCEPSAEAKCTPRGVRFRDPRGPATPAIEERPGRSASDLRQPEPSEPRRRGAPSVASASEQGDAPALTPPPRWMTLAAAPGLTAVGAIAFDASGTKAYVVGRRSKNDSLTLYISVDSGRHFDAHEIEQARLDASGLAPKVEALSVTPTGQIGLSLKRYETAYRLLFLDQGGQLTASANPPDEGALVGVYGHRTVALSDASRQVWESLDAGVSWQSLGTAPAPLCGSSRCDAAIVCGFEGCVFGAGYSRFGWVGQADAALGEARSPDVKAAKDEEKARWATPVSCTLGPGSWAALPPMAELPNASAAALGATTWFAPSVDPDTGEVAVVSSSAGRSAPWVRRRLLGATADPGRHALTVSRQIEGVAALRYRVPLASGQPLGELEVSWINLFTDHQEKMSFAVTSPWSPTDAGRERGASREAAPDLLTISERGLYVRPLASLGALQPTYYLSEHAVHLLPPLEHPPKAEGQLEMLDSGGVHQHLFLNKNGSVIARINASDQSLVSARSIGLLDPSRFQQAAFHSIGYKGASPVYYYLLAGVGGTRARAWTYLLTAEGLDAEPEAAPTQADLDDIPARCSPSEVRDSARVVAPQGSGPLHPVLVVDAIEPTRVMLTGAAVLHGSPESSCARMFDAQIVESDKDLGLGSERALIDVEDLEHSWLFRLDVKRVGTRGGAEFRSMACRFDPSLAVPASLDRLPR